MEKVCAVMFLTLLISLSGLAQNQQSEKIVIDTSLLTPQQLEQAKRTAQVEEVKTTVSTAGAVAEGIAHFGEQLGIAMDKGLGAVSKHTAEFSKTDVGKFTMFLIAWKIMAADVIRIGEGSLEYLIEGGVLFAFYIVLLISYRINVLPRTVCVESTRESLFGKRTKKYEIKIPGSTEGRHGNWTPPWTREEWMIAHVVALIVITIVICITF